MSDCKICRGTGLRPFTKHEGDRLLYTEDECLVCGGKGWDDKGATHYKVAAYLNGDKILVLGCLARNGVEALRKAAEMIQASVADGLKPGDALGIEVQEV